MKINKFWIATKPTPDSELGDICFETDIKGLEFQFKGGLTAAEIEGVYTEKWEARMLAEILMQESN